MQDIIFGLISFIIAASAFALGVAKIFKKKKPLYLQLIICAVGCFALEQLSDVVTLWCGGFSQFVTIGMLGIFGCNFFLLSANFGTLDRIVDDGDEQNKSARLIAFVAPAVVAVLMVIVFVFWKNKNLFAAIMWTAMLVPALPASYYNLKHIIMPVDVFEFLKATKLCNIFALCFYLITVVYILCSSTENSLFIGISSVLMSLSALGLVFATLKGDKKWGI